MESQNHKIPESRNPRIMESQNHGISRAGRDPQGPTPGPTRVYPKIQPGVSNEQQDSRESFGLETTCKIIWANLWLLLCHPLMWEPQGSPPGLGSVPQITEALGLGKIPRSCSSTVPLPPPSPNLHPPKSSSPTAPLPPPSPPRPHPQAPRPTFLNHPQGQ